MSYRSYCRGLIYKEAKKGRPFTGSPFSFCSFFEDRACQGRFLSLLFLVFFFSAAAATSRRDFWKLRIRSSSLLYLASSVLCSFIRCATILLTISINSGGSLSAPSFCAFPFPLTLRSPLVWFCLSFPLFPSLDFSFFSLSFPGISSFSLFSFSALGFL